MCGKLAYSPNWLQELVEEIGWTKLGLVLRHQELVAPDISATYPQQQPPLRLSGFPPAQFAPYSGGHLGLWTPKLQAGGGGEDGT